MEPYEAAFCLDWRDDCHSDTEDDKPGPQEYHSSSDEASSVSDEASSVSDDDRTCPSGTSPSPSPPPSHTPSMQDSHQHPALVSKLADSSLTPRGYQLELYQRAINENIIICVETGAGKTLISGLLINHVLHTGALGDQNKPSSAPPPSTPSTSTEQSKAETAPTIVVFLVHRVSLVQQQADVIQSIIPSHFPVGCYHGDRGVDNWSPERWASTIAAHSVLVMTAQVFLNLLRHALIRMDEISLLVVDEAHHATKSHPYRRIFIEFYHSLSSTGKRPRVFGMTATPVKAKNASSKHADCLEAMSKLEATMDSTVVSVSIGGREEVDTLVPKPDEYVVCYNPSYVDNYSHNDYDKIDHEILDKVLHNPPSTSPPKGPRLPKGVLPACEMNLLSRLNGHIGFLAAENIAARFCEQRGISTDRTLDILLRQGENLDPSTAGVRDKAFRLLDVLFLEYMRCKTEQEAKKSKDTAENTENPEKDSADEKFRTIVFSNERLAAVALSNLINDVFGKYKCSELTACPVVGTTTTTTTLVRMSSASMNKTIEAFRDGVFGILVATNVVEEGIDVPACRLVVTFDPPHSPAAYVQGRGRARKRGARYISLVAAGVEEDYKLLLRSREGARVMTDVSRGAYVTEDHRRAMRMEVIQAAITSEGLKREKTLFSRTTTARVCAMDALNLLSRYCHVKGQIMCVDDIQEPKYNVMKDGKMYKANVVLDKRIPIDGGFCWDAQISRYQAQRNAALDAYRKLYEIGEVDEHLLPKKGSRSQRVLEVSAGPIGPVRSRHKGGEGGKNGLQKKSLKKNRPPVESKASKKHKRMRVCEIAHPMTAPTEPDMIKDTKTGVDDGFLTDIDDLEDDDEDDEDEVGENSKLLADGNLAPENRKKRLRKRKRVKLKDTVEFDEDIAKGRKKQEESMFVYRIELMNELVTRQWSSRNSTSLYGIVLRRKVRTEDLNACECPSGRPLLMLSECSEVSWNKDFDSKAYRYVRAIQICLMGKTPGSDKALEMEDGYRTGNFEKPVFYLLPLREARTSSRDVNRLEIDWSTVDELLSFGWRCGSVQEHETVGRESMENVLVCSSHERFERVYISDKLSKDMTPSSASDGYVPRSYSTFQQYYETKHNVVVTDSNQALLPGYSLRETLSGGTTHVFMLLPELVRVVPLDPMACYITSLLPFWQTFMALRECWNRNGIRPIRFLDFARALQPNVNNVCDGNADLCYERSEFLGDSVLKVINSLVRYVLNPDGDEGDLSDARDIEVSNGHLCDLAMKMNLHHCVAYSGIAPKIKSWPWYWGGYERKPLNISEKVLADCLEALIGAHYQSGGFVSATLFLETHGLLPGACETLGIKVDKSVKKMSMAAAEDSGGVVMKVPQMDEGDDRHTSEQISTVEKKIGYTFREKRHLVIALTHGSWGRGHCTSYQKYEYLGDAIVGFLLLSHFHDVYPHLGPNELTKLRGPALSNNLFARVIVGLGIHRLFWYESGVMRKDIEHAASAILNEEDEESDICTRIKVPKVLGDLLEAIIGAIVVDQGMRLDEVRKVTLRLLHDQLERFANPNRFKDNIISKLLLIVQKKFRTCPDFVPEEQPNDEEKKCQVMVGTHKLGAPGVGPTFTIARRVAAEEALKELGMYSSSRVLGKDHDKDLDRVASRDSSAESVKQCESDGSGHSTTDPSVPGDREPDQKQRELVVYHDDI